MVLQYGVVTPINGLVTGIVNLSERGFILAVSALLVERLDDSHSSVNKRALSPTKALITHIGNHSLCAASRGLFLHATQGVWTIRTHQLQSGGDSDE